MSLRDRIDVLQKTYEGRFHNSSRHDQEREAYGFVAEDLREALASEEDAGARECRCECGEPLVPGHGHTDGTWPAPAPAPEETKP